MNRPRRRRSLYTRLMRAFGVYAVLVALVFGGAAAVFLYIVEDRLFDQQLADEAQALVTFRQRNGDWPAPRAPHLSVHTDVATLPNDVRVVLTRDPWRREVHGTHGRHFHVRALDVALPTTRAAPPSAWLVADVSDRLVVRAMRRTLLQTWGGIIVGLLTLALLTAIVLARRVHAPLAALANAVADDESDVRDVVPASADAEVLVLADALAEARRRVSAYVARERAFTRDASHELRTPLSVMHTSTHQVLADPTLSPASRRLLTLSARSITQLQRTIDTLLLLARDAVPIGGEPTTIRPTLEAAVLELADALDERGLLVSLDVSRTATLPVPEPVLRLLLANLLGNVLTHAAPGPVTVRLHDDALSLQNRRVDDMNGSTDPSSAPRSGFGLALVRRVAAAVGLAVTVESTPEHFTVALQPAR
jgi:signal transduction histidine kinase